MTNDASSWDVMARIVNNPAFFRSGEPAVALAVRMIINSLLVGSVATAVDFQNLCEYMGIEPVRDAVAHLGDENVVEIADRLFPGAALGASPAQARDHLLALVNKQADSLHPQTREDHLALTPTTPTTGPATGERTLRKHAFLSARRTTADA